MRITSKGQVTIPADIRQRAGLLPDTEVEFSYDGNVVTIARAQVQRRIGWGAKIAARLRGSGDIAMSTDEIMELTRGE